MTWAAVMKAGLAFGLPAMIGLPEPSGPAIVARLALNRSYEPKKNRRSLMIGPPSVAA